MTSRLLWTTRVARSRSTLGCGSDTWRSRRHTRGRETTHLALEAIADAERLAGGNSKIASLKGYVLARMGRTVAAREVLKTMEEASRGRYLPPYATAIIHAGLGDRDAMFAALDEAHAARDVHLIYLPVAMHWDPYRTDPRFIDLLARCAFSRSSARPPVR